MPQKPIISIRDLNVTYYAGRSNEVKALQGVTLDIFPGEYIIFFGPSGCGKSTLLYSIAGLERNVTDDIVVQDRNLSDMNQHELETYHQTAVGMIFQSFYLIGSLTVEQNVALPQVATRCKPQDRLARARELLEQFGVGQQGKKLPTELSGGQQQRVAICRSIMNDPAIVIADEPVGNLDSKSSNDVMELLRTLSDKQRKTVILVTHDPSHLNHANRIFFLRDGKIISTKVNTPEERAQAAMTNSALQSAVRTLAGGEQSQAAAGTTRESATNARQIFAEAVVGMSAEEMQEMEQRITHMVESQRTDRRSIVSFLKRPIAKGGIGMSAAKAERMSRKIADLIRQMRHVRKLTGKQKKAVAPHTDAKDDVPLTLLQARVLCRYLLDLLDIRLSTDAAARAVEEVIKQHLEGAINRIQSQKVLCRPTPDGGAGMHPRAARMLTRRIELIVLAPSKHGPTAPPPAAPAVSPTTDAGQ